VRLEARVGDVGDRRALLPPRRYVPDMATLWTRGCDAADPDRVAAWWASALGYVAEPGYDEPDGAVIVDPDGVEPAIGCLRVPEAKTAKYKMHKVREDSYGGDHLGSHRDARPEGNEFCVA